MIFPDSIDHAHTHGSLIFAISKYEFGALIKDIDINRDWYIDAQMLATYHSVHQTLAIAHQSPLPSSWHLRASATAFLL